MRIQLTSIVLAVSICSISSAQTPPAPVDVKPAPAVPGSDPVARPAKVEPPAAKIDEAAKKIYDGAVDAAKKLQWLQARSQLSFGGAVPPGLPAGLTEPMDVSVEFGPDANMPVSQLRVDSSPGGKEGQSMAFDGKKGKLVDYKAKTYVETGPDLFALFRGSLSAGLPQWIMEQRMDSSAQMGMPKLTEVSLKGDETLGGVDCQVITVVRTMENDQLDLADPNDPEGAGQKMQIPSLRITEVMAIAKSDSLPRRIETSMEMVGGPAGMPEQPKLTVTYTDVKAGSPIDAKVFSLETPEGFKPMADEDDAPDSQPAGLKFEKDDKAPEFSLKDLAGNEVTLASLAGKVVLLDFWATWCGPCKQAMPIMQKISEEYKDKGAVVIGVNMGERSADAGKKYMEKMKYTYTCLLGGDDLAKTYGITGIPTLVVIGKDGVIVMTEVGMANDGGKSLREAIDQALAK